MPDKMTVKLGRRVAHKARLFARRTWGELDKAEREEKAMQVMDKFHELCAAAGLNCTWQPGKARLIFVDDPTIPLPVDNKALRVQLVTLLAQAFTDSGGVDLPS